MKALWQEFTAWLASKGGVLHCLAIVYLAGLGWFTASPAFHTLVVGLWAKFPSLLQTLCVAVMQILALYGIGTGVKRVAARFVKK